jgi:hypothetical protein
MCESTTDELYNAYLATPFDQIDLDEMSEYNSMTEIDRLFSISNTVFAAPRKRLPLK